MYLHHLYVDFYLYLVYLYCPGNCATAVATTPMVGGITMAVTAVSDPFVGMLAGILARFIFLISIYSR